MTALRRQIFTNARIVDPARHGDEHGTLIVEGGVIVASGAGAHNQGSAAEDIVVDCSDKTIIPGLIDMRVHMGEPGSEHRETLASAGAAAAAGGVTAIVTMPDTNPVIDDVALVEFVLRTARENQSVRVYPAAALTLGLHGREMAEIGNLMDAGAKLFSNGRNSIKNAAVMRRVMSYASDFGVLVDHFAQDADLAGNGVMNEGLFASWLGLPGIAREAEVLPLERDIRLAALTRARYHAAKISTAQSVDVIARARDQNAKISAGASIHSLCLNETDIGAYRTFFKLSPPLRDEDDRRALVEALASGVIDVVVSDHDPQDVDTKRLPFAEAEDGAVGLETLLCAAMRLVHNGDLSLLRLCEVMSTNPAKLLGVEGGSLSPGKPADFAIVDLHEPWVLNPDALKSVSKNTAFDGARFTGKVKATYVGGVCIFNDEAD